MNLSVGDSRTSEGLHASSESELGMDPREWLERLMDAAASSGCHCRCGSEDRRLTLVDGDDDDAEYDWVQCTCRRCQTEEGVEGAVRRCSEHVDRAALYLRFLVEHGSRAAASVEENFWNDCDVALCDHCFKAAALERDRKADERAREHGNANEAASTKSTKRQRR